MSSAPNFEKLNVELKEHMGNPTPAYNGQDAIAVWQKTWQENHFKQDWSSSPKQKNCNKIS